MSFKLKKNDWVRITVGRYKNQVCQISSIKKNVFNGYTKYFLEMNNIFINRHVKKNSNRNGSVLRKNIFIEQSNVIFFRKSDSCGYKLGYRFDDSGKKLRILKKNGCII